MLACWGMEQPLHLKDILWAVTTIVEVLLLVQLIRGKLLRSYPFFSGYVACVILQSVGLALVHRSAEFDRVTEWNIAWGSQGVVALARSLALIELIQKILAQYSGIWALARRLLVSVGIGVVAYDLVWSKGMSQWLILNGVRGLELAMAAVIVTMLAFARYYRLPIHMLHRTLAVGFCLYSASYVIDYSLLEKLLQKYPDYWNFLGILTFLASVLVWLIAVTRAAETAVETVHATIPAELHGRLSSEVNLRLYLLNRQLNELLRSGDRR